LEDSYFTHPDTWNGGFYELAIQVSGGHSDEKLLSALETLWTHPDLEGCYLHADVESALQERITPSVSHIQTGEHLRGLAHLPNGLRVACGTVLVREDEGSDWLDFYLPMGALSTAYDVGGFPFGDGKKDHVIWRIPIDKWLLNIGYHVFREVRFELALIGHDVLGETSAAVILSKGIPEKRWISYLLPQGDSLRSYPCTEYGAPFTF